MPASGPEGGPRLGAERVCDYSLIPHRLTDSPHSGIESGTPIRNAGDDTKPRDLKREPVVESSRYRTPGNRHADEVRASHKGEGELTALRRVVVSMMLADKISRLAECHRSKLSPHRPNSHKRGLSIEYQSRPRK